MKQFPVTKVYSDENGDSRFEDILISMNEAGGIGALSETQPVKGIIFREVEPGYDYDFHNAPQRQYIILLDGGIEIETSLGGTRKFEPGEILLVDDTTGKGHRTRNLKPEKRRSVFITF